MKKDNTKDLLFELVRTSFKLRYKNSVLGLVWVILKPFLMFLIQYFVWSTIANANNNYFPVKLMLGIVIFTFLNEGIIFGMNGLLDKAGIILKVNFKRHIAVIASTIMAVINFVINMALFTIVFLIYIATGLANERGVSAITSLSQEFTQFFTHFDTHIVEIGYFIFIISILYMFILGASFILSILIVRLRDLQHIFELFFNILYWATPIFYTLKQVENSSFGQIVKYNPFGLLIESARGTLIFNQITNVPEMLISFVLSIIVLLLGYRYFKVKVKRVAEYF